MLNYAIIKGDHIDISKLIKLTMDCDGIYIEYMDENNSIRSIKCKTSDFYIHIISDKFSGVNPNTLPDNIINNTEIKYPKHYDDKFMPPEPVIC